MNIRRIIHIYIIVTQIFFLVRSLYIYREYSSHGDMRQVLYYIITADRKSNKCNVRIQHLISNHQRKISPESNLEDICFFYIIHLVYITQTFIDFTPYVFMFVLTCRWDHFMAFTYIQYTYNRSRVEYRPWSSTYADNNHYRNIIQNWFHHFVSNFEPKYK